MNAAIPTQMTIATLILRLLVPNLILVAPGTTIPVGQMPESVPATIAARM